MYDAGASIVIGVLLGIVAFFLARKIHALLLGVGAHPALVKSLEDCLEQAPEISSVFDLRTIQMGPDRIYVMIEASVDASGAGGDVAAAVDKVEQELKALNPFIRNVYLEAQSAEGAEVEKETT